MSLALNLLVLIFAAIGGLSLIVSAGFVVVRGLRRREPDPGEDWADYYPGEE